jgi:hypothetical protein
VKFAINRPLVATSGDDAVADAHEVALLAGLDQHRAVDVTTTPHQCGVAVHALGQLVEHPLHPSRSTTASWPGLS